ncbi:MAG TPA: Ig-like domain-containing protein [Solirubrobacteraceae bacterium]
MITNANPQGVILRDPEVGFYEGSDDVLVGIQNESSSPVSSIHIGVPGSGDDTFGLDGDGLCNPGGPPVPTECPFGPSATEDPYDYWGPDAQVTAETEDAGVVTFPEPLQPGQYTYFSLESQPGNATIDAGNDLIETSLTGESQTGAHITLASPTNVVDTAMLKGEHVSEAPVGKKVIYRLFSDVACTKEITEGGKPAGGEPAIKTEGELPASSPVGDKLATNAIYYWRAEYEGDSKNNAVIEPCGDETMTFGTPPARSGATVTTQLSGSNGVSGANITVPPGTAVTDAASVSGGASQSGKVTYYVFSDPGCSVQVTGARLGSVSSSTGAYGASGAVTLPLGTYYFQAIYSGNGSVAPARSACGTEVLTVATTPPPPPPCDCASIKTYLNKFSVFGKQSTRLGMRLNIAMTCSGGSGNGCVGEVVVHAPAGAKYLDNAKKGAKPTRIVTLACAGPCAGTMVKRVDLEWLAVKTTHRKKGKKTITTTRPIHSFLPQGRAKKSKMVIIETICHENGGFLLTKRYVMTIHFDKHGQVSYKLSDLNGDGKPDGKPLNEF